MPPRKPQRPKYPRRKPGTSKPRRSSARTPRKNVGFWKRIKPYAKSALKWGLVSGIWGVIGVAAVLTYFALSLPTLENLNGTEEGRQIILMGREGNEIFRFGSRYSDTVTMESLPEHVVQAVIAVEDRRFFQHGGLDWRGIARAMLANIRHAGFVQGGSTITQQLAKNLFLTPERSLTRKIREAILALRIESRYSKEDILRSYLSRVYFGGGAYGITAASKLYFGVSPRELSVSQAAMLAGLLKAPSTYSPLNHPEKAKARAAVVLQTMAEVGYLDPQQKELVSSQLKTTKPAERQSNQLRYFADWVLSQIEAYAAQGSEDLIITTTLSVPVQAALERIVQSTLNEVGSERHISQASGLIMGLRGDVVAMLGGVNYRESQYNRAVTALRQPGSAFKPFVYLTALDQGWRSDHRILDAPITEGRYRPTNFAGEYFGEITLQEALTRSANTATIRLTKSVGIGSVIRTARNLGITNDLRHELATALGASEVTMLNLVSAYGAFANGGFAVEPYGISRITTADGQVLYERGAPFLMRVIFPEPRADIDTMLQSVVRYGTGRGAAFDGQVVRGKTGTSQDYHDAWFVGYTDHLVGGIWLGNDDNSPMVKVTGGSYPAAIWRQVMQAAHQGQAAQSTYNAAPIHDPLRRDADAPYSPSGKSAFGRLMDGLLGSGESGGNPRPSGIQPDNRFRLNQ